MGQNGRNDLQMNSAGYIALCVSHAATLYQHHNNTAQHCTVSQSVNQSINLSPGLAEEFA